MAEYENCSDQVEGQVITKRVCQPCENKQITMVADIYCDTCGEFQCMECSKVHEMYSFMKGHNIDQVNQQKLSKSADVPVDMKGIDICVEHNKQFLFYCVDHDMLLCSSCIVSQHRKCEHIQELDSEDMKASDEIMQIQDLKTQIEKIDNSAKSMLTDLNGAKQTIGQNLEGITKMIDEKRDLIMTQFEELKVNVTTTISEKEQASDRKFDEMIAKCTTTVDTVTILQDILPDVIDHGTQSQTFILKHVVSKHESEFHTFRDTLTVKPCTFALKTSSHLTELLAPNHPLATVITNFETNQETDTLSPIDVNSHTLSAAEAKHNIYSAQPVTVNRLEEKATQIPNSLSPNDGTNPKHHEAETKDSIVTPRAFTETKVEEKAVQTYSTSDTTLPESAAKVPIQSSGQMLLQLLHSIDLEKGPGEIGKPLYTGMDFLPDGRLVAVDRKNNKLLIYNEVLDILGSYKLRGARFCVATISEDQVAVTGAGQIKLFHISQANRFRFLRDINTSADCFSISTMNESTVLVSNYDSTPSMRMISLINGSEEHFVNLRRKQYKYGTNTCTYVSSVDMLALADTDNDIVYLYTRNGNHLTYQTVKHPSIEHPIEICEGPGNSVVVCSYYTNSLVQVSTSGTVTASHKLGMSRPCTVCISSDKQRIAVANQDKTQRNQLQIYQMHHCTK